MAGEVEFGNCDICNEQKPLSRQYYHYDINCNCCVSSYKGKKTHFEMVRHCNDCLPSPPKKVNANITSLEEELHSIKDETN